MTEQLFFDLIRVAVGNQVCLSHTPSADEWGKLYDMAKKQSLVGVCFASVQKLVAQQQEPPEMLYLTWMGMAAKIQQRNEVVNRQCAELQAKLTADGFVGCILKGQSVGKHYGDLAVLRQAGDIDVWIDGDRKAIIDYVQKVAPTNEIRWLHAHLDVFQDPSTGSGQATEIEVHFFPTYMKCPSSDKALQRFFDSERATCFSRGEASQKMNEVFILAHAYRHLTNEGVGLRQLMDYYFVLAQRSNLNASEKLSRIEFEVLMKRLGMWRFAKGVMWIMHSVFGLPADCLLCDVGEDDGRFLLAEVMQSGNFGHYDERNAHEANESALHRFWRLNTGSFRIFAFAYKEVLWAPVWRIKHWIWRKSNGYK